MRQRVSVLDWPAGLWILAWLWLSAPLWATEGRVDRVMAWWLDWTRSAPVDPWGKLVWFLPPALAMTVLYRPVLVRIKGWPRSRTVGFAAAYGVLAMLTLPLLSHDALTFIAEARVLAVHHMNPLAHAIVDVPGWQRDPWLKVAGWTRTVNPYGPFWFLLTGLLGRVAAPFWPLYAGFKAVAVGSALVTTWALSRLGGERGAEAAWAFWFHPLVGLEVLASCQNDAMMVACLVGAFALYRGGRYGAAGLLAGVSAGTKIVPLVLFPWLVIGLGPWEIAFLVGGGTVSLVAGYLALWPGLHGLLVPWANQSLFLRSPAFAVAAVLRRLGGFTVGRSRAVGAAFAEMAFVAWWTDRGLRSLRDEGRDPFWLGEILLGLALIGLTWFQYWYLLWALPFYCVSRRSEASRTVAFLASAELARTLAWVPGLGGGLGEGLQFTLLWIMFLGWRRPWATLRLGWRRATTRA